MLNPINKTLVQHKLNEIGYEKPFNIIFLKKDGSQKMIKQAMMEKPKKAISPNAPVVVLDVSTGKYASFYIDKVLFLE